MSLFPPKSSSIKFGNRPTSRCHSTGSSLFLVGLSGNAMERFWNGMNWVWLRHKHSALLQGIFAVHEGAIFAGDSAGRLLMRERHGVRLRWRDLGRPGCAFARVSLIQNRPQN